MVEGAAKLMIVGGIALVVVGLAFWGGAKLGLGRLPGDIVIDRGNLHVAFPIVTSIVLSIVLTIVLNIVLRTWR